MAEQSQVPLPSRDRGCDFDTIQMAAPPWEMAERACPVCGQVIELPTTDLRRAFRCPRCMTVQLAGKLVDILTPVAALPVTTSRLAPVPQLPPGRWVPSDIGAGSFKGGTESPHSGGWSQRARIIQFALQAGVHWLRAASERVLILTEKLDGKLHGKRWMSVLVVSVAVLVAPLLDWVFKTTQITIAAMILLVALGTVLLFARVGSFRDEDDNWSPGLVRTRARGAINGVREWFSILLAAKSNRRWVIAGRLLFAFGTVIQAGTNTAALTFGLNPFLSHLGWCLVGFGLFGLWRGRLLRATDASAGFVVADVPALERSVAGLPALVDVRHGNLLRGLAGDADQPLVKALLESLRTWRPRACRDEYDYQASLHRHLMRVMPEAEPERELPLPQVEGRSRRADLVLGGHVLIEMKRKSDAASIQRAIGQVAMYSQLWRGRGPVILLLCEAGPQLDATFLSSSVGDLRRNGYPIAAVVAGRATRVSA